MAQRAGQQKRVWEHEPINSTTNQSRTFKDTLRLFFPVLVVALLLGSQLLIQPIVGMADNGDFVNITDPLRLVPNSDAQGLERFFGRVIEYWRHDPYHHGKPRLLTSEWLVIMPAYWMTAPFTNGGFDLRLAGLVHSVLFLLALGLAAPAIGVRLPIWALIVLIWCDAAYFCWFNSLYMDTASFLFLMLAVACYLRLAGGVGSMRWNGFGVVFFLLLFLTSKLQHAILIVPIAVWLWVDPRVRTAVSRGVLAGFLALMAGGVYGMFQHVPEDYQTMAAYHVIFNELAPKSGDPVKTLAEFGLSKEMVTYLGTDAFEANSGLRHPIYRPELMQKATQRALMMYYLRHPATGLRMLTLGLRDSSLEREPGYGNWTAANGKPLRAPATAFTLSTQIKTAIWSGHPLIYAGYLALVSAFAFLQLRRKPVFYAIFVAAAMEFFLSSLADSKETTRHLFLFRVLVDLLLTVAVSVWWARRSSSPASPCTPHNHPAH